jgi:hypothetical protein
MRVGHAADGDPHTRRNCKRVNGSYPSATLKPARRKRAKKIASSDEHFDRPFSFVAVEANSETQLKRKERKTTKEKTKTKKVKPQIKVQDLQPKTDAI